MQYSFGPFTIDMNRQELQRHERIVPIEPQVFDLLVLLVENRDRVVSRDEIFDKVWQGRIVSDVNLSSRVAALRRALGDDGKKQEYIKTVHARGFRLVAEVEELDPSTVSKIDRNRPVTRRAIALLAALSLVAGVVWLGLDRMAELAGFSDGNLEGKPGIAVLPFENRLGDSGQDYFADGLTEDIMAELSRFDLFNVINRNSTFGYRGPDIELDRVAGELNVRYVLDGNLSRTSEGLSVTARLTDTRSLQLIWSEKYAVPVEEVFDVRDSIAKGIVTTVAPEFLTAEMQRAMRLQPRDFDAWDLFIRGYWHLLRFTKLDNRTAQRHLKHAIDIDPLQANYHGLLSVTYLMDGFYGWGPDREESMNLALRSAERGLALDDRNSLVLRSIGLVKFFSKRHETALEYFRRAVDANPGEAENLALLGAALGVNGEYQESVEHFERAFALSPRDEHTATWYHYLSIAAFVDERYDVAADWSRKAVLENPEFSGGHRTLAASAGVLGNLEEAEVAGEQLKRLIPGISLSQLSESLPYFVESKALQTYLEGLRTAGIPE